MPEIYFVDSKGNFFTDKDLKMIVLKKHVPKFPKQRLIQDEIPYSNQKVTYGRKKENLIITLSIVFDISSQNELNHKVDALNQIIYDTFIIGFYEEGFEYECNLVGEIEQEDIKKYIKKFTFAFETTTPDKIPIM